MLVNNLKLVERVDKNVSFKPVILPPLGLYHLGQMRTTTSPS